MFCIHTVSHRSVDGLKNWNHAIRKTPFIKDTCWTTSSSSSWTEFRVSVSFQQHFPAKTRVINHFGSHLLCAPVSGCLFYRTLGLLSLSRAERIELSCRRAPTKLRRGISEKITVKINLNTFPTPQVRMAQPCSCHVRTAFPREMTKVRVGLENKIFRKMN